VLGSNFELRKLWQRAVASVALLAINLELPGRRVTARESPSLDTALSVCVPACRLEAEITNKIRMMGGKESPTALLRELECAALLSTRGALQHHVIANIVWNRNSQAGSSMPY